MENIEKKQTADISIRKIFDLKMKQGHEMKKVYVDEVKVILKFLLQTEFLKMWNLNSQEGKKLYSYVEI